MAAAGQVHGWPHHPWFGLQPSLAVRHTPRSPSFWRISPLKSSVWALLRLNSVESTSLPSPQEPAMRERIRDQSQHQLLLSQTLVTLNARQYTLKQINPFFPALGLVLSQLFISYLASRAVVELTWELVTSANSQVPPGPIKSESSRWVIPRATVLGYWVHVVRNGEEGIKLIGL